MSERTRWCVECERLAAELAAVKEQRDELHVMLKSVVNYAIDVIGQPPRTAIGSDAPLRAMRTLHEQRDAARADAEKMRDLVGDIRAYLSRQYVEGYALALLEMMNPALRERIDAAIADKERT